MQWAWRFQGEGAAYAGWLGAPKAAGAAGAAVLPPPKILPTPNIWPMLHACRWRWRWGRMVAGVVRARRVAYRR